MEILEQSEISLVLKGMTVFTSSLRLYSRVSPLVAAAAPVLTLHQYLPRSARLTVIHYSSL